MVTFSHIISQIDSDTPTGATLVALVGGVTVGALTLSLDEPGGYIRSCFVTQAYRGQQIGRSLIGQAEAICKEYGRTCVMLSVKDTNTEAQRLYTELGFIPNAVVYDGYTQRIKMLPTSGAHNTIGKNGTVVQPELASVPTPEAPYTT